MKIKQFFISIWKAIVGWLNLYTAEEYSTLLKDSRDTQRELVKIRQEYADYVESANKSLNEALEAVTSANKKVQNLIAEANELKYELQRQEEYKQVDAEFLREVQKQLSNEFKNHPVFGFADKPGLPGSVSVRNGTKINPDGPSTVLQGRFILDDICTKAVNERPHMYEKISEIWNYMMRTGLASRIVSELINSGAITMTLAYRTDTTTYELYYELCAKNYGDDAVLRFDSETGCKAVDMGEEEKKNGEG